MLRGFVFLVLLYMEEMVEVNLKFDERLRNIISINALIQIGLSFHDFDSNLCINNNS